MTHCLDRPIWHALAEGHQHLALGDDLARRYPPAISPFAAARDASPEALSALAELIQPGEEVILVEAGAVAMPDALAQRSTAIALQMTNERPFAPIEDARIVALTPDSADEMLDLALLTRPGPFTRGAQSLGPFWGIWIEGRLAAMAGHRLTMTGWTELSGVCVHPDFRGQGLARLLSHYVSRQASAGGDKVFLHAYASNAGAVRLYETLGFAVRAQMQVVVAARQ